MKLDLYSTIEIIRANDWGDRCSKQWNLHNRFPPRKNKVYLLPWTRIGTSFLQAFYFHHSFKNYLEKWMQLSHTVSVLCPRSLKMLNTTTRFSYNFKKHILSKLLCGQSLVNPFYAYSHLTFHSFSELCDFLLCSKNKGNAYLRKKYKNI
jgi:hypothetical protein